MLELKPNATVEELKEARKELLQVWHPDKFVSSPRLAQKALEKSQKINLAYQTLLPHLKSNQYLDLEKNYSETETVKKTQEDIYQKEMNLAFREQEARNKRIERQKRRRREMDRHFEFIVAFAFVIFSIFLLAYSPCLAILLIVLCIIVILGRSRSRKR